MRSYICLVTERVYEKKKTERNLEGVATQKSEIVLLKSEVNPAVIFVSVFMMIQNYILALIAQWFECTPAFHLVIQSKPVLLL